MRVLFLSPDPPTTSHAAVQWAVPDLHIEYASGDVAGRQLAVKGDFDCLILERNAAGDGSFELCRALRREGGPNLPLVMLSDQAPLEDRLAAFSAGVDDFLVRPFDPRELAARMRALYRRARSVREQISLSVGDLEHNPATCETWRGGRPVRLGRAGRRLLELLMRASPEVVTRQRLAFEIWGSELPERDLLRSHLSTLRQAVDGGERHKLLHTVHRVGVRLA